MARPLSFSNQAIAYKCIDDVHFIGEGTLGNIGLRGVFICNRTTPAHQRAQRALEMILTGAGLATGPAAPWGGFTYHETTLKNLTRQLGYMMEQTRQALTGLRISCFFG